MRAKHQLNIKTKDAELNEYMDKVILFENNNDKLQRENSSLKSENNKFYEKSQLLLKNNSTKYEDLEKKILCLENERNSLKNDLKIKIDQFKEEKRTLERQNRDFSNKLNIITNNMEMKEKEKYNNIEEIKRLSFRINEYERERNIAIEECENLRKMHHDRLSEAIND
jgi:hypothetical protein